ncbi:MAG: hypothetical protein RIS64_3519 [Bacteroidota bacterium]|jgi:hypothetical protein
MQVKSQKNAPKVLKTRGAFFALNNAKDKNAPKVFKTHGAFFLFEQCQRFIKSLCDAPNQRDSDHNPR